jgi:hypothetical protein
MKLRRPKMYAKTYAKMDILKENKNDVKTDPNYGIANVRTTSYTESKT